MRWRALFEWSGAGIIVPAIIGAAGVVVSISLNSQIGPALIGIAAVWTLVTVLLDEAIHYKKGALCAVVIVAGVVIVWLETTSKAKELEDKEGDLIPSTLPTPVEPQGCVPSGALGIYFGGSAASTHRFPQVVFTSHGVDLLVLDRNDKGRLRVSARIFDDRGDLIARLERNHFIVTNTASHMERPDESNLVVYDHLDQKALWVSYLNRDAIKVSGIFHYPGAPTLIVKEDRMIVGSNAWQSLCVVGQGRAAVYGF